MAKEQRLNIIYYPFAVGSSAKNIKGTPNGAGVASFYSIKICDEKSGERKWGKKKRSEVK